MTGKGEFSTGVIEWRVIDAGGSPEFPPIVNAGPDRVVIEGGQTYLNAIIRSTGKPGANEQFNWSKVSGPGDISFADRFHVEHRE